MLLLCDILPADLIALARDSSSMPVVEDLALQGYFGRHII